MSYLGDIVLTACNVPKICVRLWFAVCMAWIFTMYLSEVGGEDVDWIHLALVENKWQAVLYVVMTLQVT